MGFYLRKSVRVGGLRFNLSKSGIGVSAGIPGFRVGTGPRGTYVHAGRGGLYYRSHLFSGGHPSSRPAVRFSQPLAPPSPGGDGLTEIQSAPADTIVDETSESVLHEVRARRAAFALTPVTVVAAMIAVGWGLTAGPAVVITVLLAIPAIVWAALRDAQVRNTVLMYDLEDDALQAFQQLHEAFTRLMSCARVWNVDAAGANADYKYHAGATQLLRRRQAKVTFGRVPGIRTNIPVPALTLRDERLYFFPERVFVYGRSGIGAVMYSQLEARATTTRFIEEEALPGDGRVVGHTWKYLNKNGTPDRRFARNPQLPILVYGELFLASVSGLRAYLQTSRESAPLDVVRAIDALRAMNVKSPERPAIVAAAR